MPTPDPFPLNITPKVDNPALTAWLEQYGLDKYISAEDINKILTALEYLYENSGGGTGAIPALFEVLGFDPNANGLEIILSDISGDQQKISAAAGDILIESGAYSVIISANGGLKVSNGVETNNLRLVNPLDSSKYINLFGDLIDAAYNVQLQKKSGVLALMEDVLAVAEGISWKNPGAVVLIDTPIGMNGVIPQNTLGTTYQGVTLAPNDRVVLAAQANPIYNGIYRMYEAGGFQRFARTNDANATNELNNAVINVTSGTYADKLFRQTTSNPVIGTSNIVFQSFANAAPMATNLVAGLLKIYDSLGSDTDGTIHRAALTTLFGLKADKTELTSRVRVLCLVNNPSLTHTGNTSTTTLYTLPLPANTLAVGDRGVIDYQVSQTIVNAAQFNGECYINGSPAIEICRFRTSLTTHTFIGGLLSFEVLAGNLIRIKEVSSTTDYGSNAVLYSTFAFNPTVYNELLFAVKLGNSANTGKIERIKVTKESL